MSGTSSAMGDSCQAGLRVASRGCGPTRSATDESQRRQRHDDAGDRHDETVVPAPMAPVTSTIETERAARRSRRPLGQRHAPIARVAVGHRRDRPGSGTLVNVNAPVLSSGTVADGGSVVGSLINVNAPIASSSGGGFGALGSTTGTLNQRQRANTVVGLLRRWSITRRCAQSTANIPVLSSSTAG